MFELSVIVGRNSGSDNRRSPLFSGEANGSRDQSPVVGSSFNNTSRLVVV